MKVSAFTKAKNRAGKVFTTFKTHEAAIVAMADKPHRVPERDENVSPNAEYNWDRTNSGARVWSF